MPYTRQDVINTYRQQFPQLKPLNDNDIWRVAAINDPELAKGISELTMPPPSPDADKRNLPAGPILPQRLLDLVPALNMARLATAKPSIMSEHAASVLEGIADTPAVLRAGVSNATQATYLPPALQAILGGYGIFRQIKPYEATARQAIELASPGTVKAPTPDSPEAFAASRQSGTNLAMAELPNVASGAAIAAKAGITGLGRLIQKGVVNPPIVNRWMGIKPGDVTHGANPGQQLLDDNLLGSTKEATLAKIKPEMDQLGKTLDSQLAAGDAQGLTYDAKAIVNKRFTELLNKGVIRTSDKAFRKKILNIQDNISAKLQNQGLNWQSLSPSGVHKLKVEIGDSIDWTGVPAEDAINRSLMKIYGDLNTPLKADIPQLGANLERWGNLRLAQKGLQSGVAKDVVGQGTGTIAGVAAKRIAKGAAIAGTGTYVANKIRAALD